MILCSSRQGTAPNDKTTRYARVVELVDSLDSGSSAHSGRGGSTPPSRTIRKGLPKGSPFSLSRVRIQIGRAAKCVYGTLIYDRHKRFYTVHRPQRGGDTHISQKSVPKSRFLTASPSREKPLVVTSALFQITQVRRTRDKASPLGEKLSAPGSSEPGAD